MTHSDTPTPDGPPAAAPERKAETSPAVPVPGERFVHEDPDYPGWWEVHKWVQLVKDGPITSYSVATSLLKADAELLTHGHARLRAMEAALSRYVEGDVCSCVAGGYGGDFPCEQCQGRAALGAGPGT